MITKLPKDHKFKHRRLADVEYFQDICRKYGYHLDLRTCASVWEEHSDMYCAGWIGYDEETDIWNVFYNYIERNEGLITVKIEG